MMLLLPQGHTAGLSLSLYGSISYDIKYTRMNYKQICSIESIVIYKFVVQIGNILQYFPRYLLPPQTLSIYDW